MTSWKSGSVLSSMIRAVELFAALLPLLDATRDGNQNPLLALMAVCTSLLQLPVGSNRKNPDRHGFWRTLFGLRRLDAAFFPCWSPAFRRSSPPTA
jgi:hypothetical protein